MGFLHWFLPWASDTGKKDSKKSILCKDCILLFIMEGTFVSYWSGTFRETDFSLIIQKWDAAAYLDFRSSNFDRRLKQLTISAKKGTREPTEVILCEEKPPWVNHFSLQRLQSLWFFKFLISRIFFFCPTWPAAWILKIATRVSGSFWNWLTRCILSAEGTLPSMRM